MLLCDNRGEDQLMSKSYGTLSPRAESILHCSLEWKEKRGAPLPPFCHTITYDPCGVIVSEQNERHNKNHIMKNISHLYIIDNAAEDYHHSPHC